MLSNNPFIQNIKAIRIVKTTKIIDNTDTDVIHEENNSTFLIEQDAKVSLYKLNIEDLFSKTTSVGRDLFIYITFNLRKNKDSIKLNADKISKSLNVSRQSIYNGVEQLVEFGIIQEKENDEYWVNVNVIFNGSRIKFLKEHVDIVHTAKHNIDAKVIS